MAKPRSILLRVEVRPAGRLAHCARNKQHDIRKGEPRFVVRAPGPAGGEKGYCAVCATTMLEAAEKELSALRAGLVADDSRCSLDQSDPADAPDGSPKRSRAI